MLCPPSVFNSASYVCGGGGRLLSQEVKLLMDNLSKMKFTGLISMLTEVQETGETAS